MVGITVVSLSIAKGPRPVNGQKVSWGEWFLGVTHVEQADQSAQAAGAILKENDRRFDERRASLDSKMDQQREKMDRDQERLRAAQERNDAVKARLQVQMERLKNR